MLHISLTASHTHTHMHMSVTLSVSSLFFLSWPTSTVCPLVFTVYIRWNATKPSLHSLLLSVFAEDDWLAAYLEKTSVFFWNWCVSLYLWCLLSCHKIKKKSFFKGTGSFFIFPNKPLNPGHPSSCCTQLYYQSDGHVVHCKILYIENLLWNVF